MVNEHNTVVICTRVRKDVDKLKPLFIKHCILIYHRNEANEEINLYILVTDHHKSLLCINDPFKNRLGTVSERTQRLK